MFPGIAFVAIPLDDGLAVLDIDGPGLAVEPEACPIPEFERENIRRRADFEHHTARARAMERAGGNEKMVVAFGWESTGKPRVVEGLRAKLSGFEIGDHGFGIRSVFATQEHLCTRSGVEDVVTLVLGVVQAEVLAGIGGEGVNLEGQIAALHGIEEIEADGKLGAKSPINGLTEERLRLKKHKIDRGDFHTHLSKREKEGIFLGHAIKAPGIVRGPIGQIANLPHPLTPHGPKKVTV